jgi:hypothetical protein
MTGAITFAGAQTWPTFNQNTTGTAAGLSATLAVASGGTGVTTSTGTGSVVLSTSPTLVTPLLGTPTSGNFSTGTFTWPTFNQNTTGTAAGLSATLGVASGGTGLTTLTANRIPYGNGTSAFQSSANLTFDGTLLTGLEIATTSAFSAQRTNATTTAQLSIANFTAISTGDMVDGFGPQLRYFIKDTAGVDNLIATTSAVRAGGDTTGAYVINVGTSGTTEGLRVTSTGVGVGTTTPSTYGKLVVVDGTLASVNSGGNQQLVTVANSSVTLNVGVNNANIPTNASITTVGSHTLGFGTVNTERFRIGTAGELGIGGATYGTSGQVLTSGGSGAAPTWATVSAGADVQAFTSSGTWTKPSGKSIVMVEIWGGGGGGGGGDGNTVGGHGGGGGAYSYRLFPVADLGSTVTVTIGGTASGASAGGSTGSAGNNSTFGSHLTGYGGALGGRSMPGGGGGGAIEAGLTTGGGGPLSYYYSASGGGLSNSRVFGGFSGAFSGSASFSFDGTPGGFGGGEGGAMSASGTAAGAGGGSFMGGAGGGGGGGGSVGTGGAGGARGSVSGGGGTAGGGTGAAFCGGGGNGNNAAGGAGGIASGGGGGYGGGAGGKGYCRVTSW